MADLRTDRLLLRHWRDADRAPFAALNADPEVMRHFPAPMSREDSDALDLRAVAACWCTRTMVESTDTRQSTPPSASAATCNPASTRSQVPSADQR